MQSDGRDPAPDGSPARVLVSGLGRAVGCLATLVVLGLIVAGALKLLLALISG